jgi:hypothetical protein
LNRLLGSLQIAMSILEKGLQKLNSHNYETINNLMMKISKEHNISGKQLHNDFTSEHGKTPDNWIKEKK